MVKGILGRKVGMTQIYDESGAVTPVTVIQAGPCHVLQLRTEKRDGYEAVQLGFGDKPRRLAHRSETGHIAQKMKSKRSERRSRNGVELPPKPGCEPKRFIRELRGSTDGYKVGQQVTVAALTDVKAVDVVGVSKGRGFAGAMKRHGFAGQRASHGVKKVHRHMGGTGSRGAWLGGGRPKKGKKMPGRFGGDRVTVRNLQLIRVDENNNLLLIKGAVPGANGKMLVIRETNKVG